MIKKLFEMLSQGSILINAKIICDIVRKIDGNEITFELLDDSVAKIANDRTVFKLNSIRAEEYQDIDFTKTGTNLKIKRTDFVDAVNQVSFAASTKDTQTILTAINFTGEAGILTLTATDGARLALRKLSVNIQERFSANIPCKTLLETLKSITDEEDIDIFVSDKKVLFVLKIVSLFLD
jgi:DNA polymerase-3 subunit beta